MQPAALALVNDGRLEQLRLAALVVGVAPASSQCIIGLDIAEGDGPQLQRRLWHERW
jgi:hypothetical protein